MHAKQHFKIEKEKTKSNNMVDGIFFKMSKIANFTALVH